jgi:uncharacterized coiled-coil protein SlyX
MSEQEMECLRCGSIEVDCECEDGFQANVYDRIADLMDLIAELQAENKRLKDGMEVLAEHFRTFEPSGDIIGPLWFTGYMSCLEDAARLIDKLRLNK